LKSDTSGADNAAEPLPGLLRTEGRQAQLRREVLGITVASHRDLETLLQGFNQAYNARRQRVLKGRSPDMLVRERLSAAPDHANRSHDPPFDPCILPKALQVIARAKDVSHPDTYWSDNVWTVGFRSPRTVGISSETVGWIGTAHCRIG
jgi:hypothetical protein